MTCHAWPRSVGMSAIVSGVVSTVRESNYKILSSHADFVTNVFRIATETCIGELLARSRVFQ